MVTGRGVGRRRRRLQIVFAILGLAFAGCGGDGAAKGISPDADEDTILNKDEGKQDETNTDEDDYLDWLDLDSDGDRIPDADEAGDDDPKTPPVDTDKDGTPDFQDTDSDNDGVPDSAAFDADGKLRDSDDDGTPDYLDPDDDGDDISDAIERPGGHDQDADGDGTPDALDDDSDGDGISDADEGSGDSDADGRGDFRDLDSDDDGLPDADELAAGSSTTEDDTDGDDVPDLVEVVAGTDPSDDKSVLDPGDFYFVLPFEDPAQDGVLDFSTNIRKADVFFSVDTTGSFGEEIAAIQSSIGTLIVPQVGDVIADAAFGVGRFEDFPLEPFGLPSDVPFELLQSVTTDLPMIQAGVDALPPAAGGLDTPEAGMEALYQWASGTGIPEAGLPAFWPGDIGGAGFRQDALPILVQITDARSHDPADYTAMSIATRDRDATVDALRAIGARVIGIRSTENLNTADDPRDELEDLAVASGATIPPTNDECATGIDGAARAPLDVGGNAVCPLVFDVRPDGTGLGSVIVDAIEQLASLSNLDISARPIGKLKGENGEKLPPLATTADFIQAITAEPPVPDGATIDGEVFRGVRPGSTVNFRLTARNDFVPHTAQVQLFTIEIQILGDGVTVLDTRTVFVVVPKAVPDLVVE